MHAHENTRTISGRTQLLKTQGNDDHRREERVPVSLPININNIEGVTRDISLSGICFESNQAYELGDVVRYVVAFGNMGGNLALKCRGEVVRVEHRQGKTYVSVKILESALEPA
jgi:hypothetical protein